MRGEYNRPIKLFAQDAPLECVSLASEVLDLYCRSRIGIPGAIATWARAVWEKYTFKKSGCQSSI